MPVSVSPPTTPQSCRRLLKSCGSLPVVLRLLFNYNGSYRTRSKRCFSSAHLRCHTMVGTREKTTKATPSTTRTQSVAFGRKLLWPSFGREGLDHLQEMGRNIWWDKWRCFAKMRPLNSACSSERGRLLCQCGRSDHCCPQFGWGSRWPDGQKRCNLLGSTQIGVRCRHVSIHEVCNWFNYLYILLQVRMD